MVVRKDELEIQLKEEHEMIQAGVLKDDNPLDTSPKFLDFSIAVRTGDLKACQELVSAGVNINARDAFDNTPLILASLCGHYEVVKFLLENGALCERDTFQGERCIYNALTDRIRNLLISYDYSKSTDPFQPFAYHITSLLTKTTPNCSDITLTADAQTFHLHKFILSARSPYFENKLYNNPETKTWKLASTIPAESFYIAVRYLYLGDFPPNLGLTSDSLVTEAEVLNGVSKISAQLEIEKLWQGLLAGNDRRIARQVHESEVSRGRTQIELWFLKNIIGHKMVLDSRRVSEVKWIRDNAIFADVLLCAEIVSDEEDLQKAEPMSQLGIPIGPSEHLANGSLSNGHERPRKSVLYPAHRAMLIRADYFLTMFSSQFQEAQITEHLHVIKVDCTPEVLEIVLSFLYTEKAEIPIELALDVLIAADMLFIEKLKLKAAVVISTIGGGGGGTLVDRSRTDEVEVELINVYDVMRAAWQFRIQRLETFAARYLAYRLEDYIDEEEFSGMIKESASKIENRQETDTIELLDDIRFYLNERFRFRMEDAGLEEILDEEGNVVETFEDTQGNNILEAPIAYRNYEIEYGPLMEDQVRAMNGQIADDEAAADAINYEILLEKIDDLLERLKLDA